MPVISSKALPGPISENAGTVASIFSSRSA